MTICLSVLGCL